MNKDALPDPPDTGWTPDEWAFEARQARDALAALGVIVPRCLPDEHDACGDNAWGHYATYLCMIQARAQVFLETNVGTTLATYYHDTVYHEILNEYRREIVDDGSPPVSN